MGKGNKMNIMKLYKYIDKKGYDIQSFEDYIEPRYGLNGKNGVLLANWNNIPKKFLKAMETYFCIEWADEWAACSHCNKILRTVWDSYGWEPSYKFDEYGVFLCLECYKKEWEE